MNDVTSAARRNPMQAVAVGASIAYPLLRIARAIPLPVLMVGAGLFFAGSKTGQAATQKASDMAADVSEEMVRRAHDLGDQVQDTASAAKNYASDQYERISSAVAGGTSQIKGATNTAGATMASSSGKIKDSAWYRPLRFRVRSSQRASRTMACASLHSAASTVQDIASGALAATRSVASSVADTGADAARSISAKASDASDRAGKTILQTIEQNPLLRSGGRAAGRRFDRECIAPFLSSRTTCWAIPVLPRSVRCKLPHQKAFDTAKTAVGEILR